MKTNAVVPVVSKRVRRTAIPEKPNYSLNLWSIMKNCIGKELTKIPMPVSETIYVQQKKYKIYMYGRICCHHSEV